MKALTIKEPCATAIATKLKHYETRSWSTNHRGPLLIHAGKSPWLVSKAWYQADKSNIIPNYGKIVCKCNIVDCVLIDDNFINSLRDNSTELNLGIFEKGRYAWVLEDIEMFDITTQPIVSGKLGLWNYEF